jgi:uncharacterized protein YbjT (DUF2867 family)
MLNKKIIAVVGATGNQGSGLVRAILNDPAGGFIPRVITRDANSAKAQEFVKAGAEVAYADLDNQDSIRKAFEGAYGAFCVTMLSLDAPENEIKEAKNMAQAAKDTGLQHVIYSTLEDTRKWVPLTDNRMPTLHGKYKVPHFDSKAEGEKYFRDLGVPTTFLLTSYFWDNLLSYHAPKKNQNGELAFTLPIGDQKMAGIATEDIGRCAYGIFKRGSEFVGKTVGIAGEHLTGKEMADALTKALGQKIVFNEVAPEVYRSFGFPGADDLGNMFQFYRDFADDFCGRRSLESTRDINPTLKSFDAWLAENAKKIPLQ